MAAPSQHNDSIRINGYNPVIKRNCVVQLRYNGRYKRQTGTPTFQLQRCNIYVRVDQWFSTPPQGGLPPPVRTTATNLFIHRGTSYYSYTEDTSDKYQLKTMKWLKLWNLFASAAEHVGSGLGTGTAVRRISSRNAETGLAGRNHGLISEMKETERPIPLANRPATQPEATSISIHQHSGEQQLTS